MASTPPPLPPRPLKPLHPAPQAPRILTPQQRMEELIREDHRPWFQPMNTICFRSDTRPPEEIFKTGFLDRETGERKAELLGKMNADASLTDRSRVQLMTAMPATPVPTYRNLLHFLNHGYAGIPANQSSYDVDPDSSVALSLMANVVPLFPLDTLSAPRMSWVYAVWVQRGYMTYERQSRDRPAVASAREVAVRYAPHIHVFAAVRCARVGLPTPGGWLDFNMEDTIRWNGLYASPDQRGAIADHLRPLQNTRHRIRFHADGYVAATRIRTEPLVFVGNLPTFPAFRYVLPVLPLRGPAAVPAFNTCRFQTVAEILKACGVSAGSSSDSESDTDES